ncbi:MAG: zinc-ribbon domain-containing protein [Chloroflexi bacterium]|nr:zinc-ribbon domain-containing protein [Chloroflexota bacterium]
MQCTNCGNNLQPNAAFCNNCGTPVSRQAPQDAGQTIQAPLPPYSGSYPQGGPPGPMAGPGGPTMAAPGGAQYSGGGQPYGGGQPPYAGAPSGAAPSGGAPSGGAPYAGAPAGYPARPSTPPQYGSQPANPYGQPAYGSPYGGQRMAGMGGFNVNALTNRLTRLLKFDTTVFREARADPTALLPGIITAAVSIFIMAMGTFLWAVLKSGDLGGNFEGGRFFLREVVLGTIFGLAFWAAWVGIAGLILQSMFKRQVNIQSLFGPMGLATVPMVIGILMLIHPVVLTFGVIAIGGAAMLSQVALQESTDATAGEAFLANLAGFAVWAIALTLLGRDDAQLAPGIWAINILSSF